MAFGDLIYNESLPPKIKFKIGTGITSLPGQFVITGFGKENFESGYFDATNNLDFTGILETPEAFTAIHYNEADNSFWCVAPYIATPFPQTSNIYLFHIKSDGTPISSFDITEILPPSLGNSSTAISLSPDGNEVLLALSNTTEIYQFDTNGNYLGVKTFSPAGIPINGITTDGQNLWICTSSKNSLDFTIYKTDSNYDILDSFSNTIPSPTNSLSDIEFDKYNFTPGCAIVIKSNSRNEENGPMYISAFEVPCTSKQPCQEPPVINSNDKYLSVGDFFDPYVDVAAIDCDGSDITDIALNVIYNNVNTSTVGIYTVTYEATSLINNLSTTKTIYVTVTSCCSRYQPITDIIQSIALEQTALSHILNAEGKKIQKALALNLSDAEILKINKSVDDTVKSVAKLEMVLQSKLEMFEDCLCDSGCDCYN